MIPRDKLRLTFPLEGFRDNISSSLRRPERIPLGTPVNAGGSFPAQSGEVGDAAGCNLIQRTRHDP